MQPLTQPEIDLVLGLHWEQIVAIRSKLTRIDEQRDDLAHVATQFDQQKLVSVMLLDETGNVYFNHRTTPGQPCQLMNNVIQECTAHLIRERRQVFEHTQPAPEPATRQPAVHVKPTASELSTDGLVWHTRESLAEVLGIALISVYATANRKQLPKKREGKQVLYGLPAH